MNFLSHYYIDAEVDIPEYTLGKILPDLLRNYHKGLRIKPEGALANEYHLINLNKGILNHYAVDAFFHNSAFFTSNTDQIKKALKSNTYDNIHKYFYFYAHILLEIMLDRLLLKRDQNIGIGFYDHLNSVKEETIKDFFRYNKIELNAKEFFLYLKSFTNARYLFSYINNESLIYALGRINQRAGLAPFSAQDVEKLILIIDEIEVKLQQHYFIIFKEIRKKLIDAKN